MENQSTLRGMANVSFWAEDVKAARSWYSEVLGIEPYFQRPDAENPAYVEFRVGDFQQEFGIINKNYQPPTVQPGPGGVVLYWHVDDIGAVFEMLLQKGATEHEPVTERGSGFVTASVIDPFGNILGIQYNPHYLQILKDKG